MAKKQRKKIFLVAAFLSLVGFSLSLFALAPTTSLNISLTSIPYFYLMFFFIFLFFYSLTAFIFRSFIHGILVGLFPVTYLIMRLNDLTGLLFLVLLAGIFITLEILLVQFTKSPVAK